jgi:Tol biopolymer transport system component
MERITHLLFIPITTCLTFVLISCSVFNSSNGEDDGSGPRTIVFAAAEPDEEFQIFSMREDGSGIKQLTNFDDSAQQPSWSPDGERIVFVRYKSTSAELWVMNADGSNPHPLITNPQTGNPQLGVGPAWSPDGTKVAFASCCGFSSNSDIVIADLQTGKTNTITDGPLVDNNPTWSPDGKRIAFVSDRDYVDADSLRFRADLYLKNMDDSSLTRLTSSGFIGSYTWIATDTIIYVTYNFDNDLKKITSLNIKTGDQKVIVNNLKASQFWIHWDAIERKLFTFSKKNKELPLIITTFDSQGGRLEQNELKNTILKSSLGYDLKKIQSIKK